MKKTVLRITSYKIRRSVASLISQVAQKYPNNQLQHNFNLSQKLKKYKQFTIKDITINFSLE